MPPVPLNPSTRRARLEDVPVRDVMTPDPVSVRHGVTVREAAAFLADREIGSALVFADDGRAIGVITRSDVLNAVNAGVEERPVSQVMSPAVIAVHPDADALQAFTIMARCVIGRVFVLDDDGIPVGVVSAADLLRTLTTRWRECEAASTAF
jgi:predicted transcriptional regulator